MCHFPANHTVDSSFSPADADERIGLLRSFQSRTGREPPGTTHSWSAPTGTCAPTGTDVIPLDRLARLGPLPHDAAATTSNAATASGLSRPRLSKRGRLSP